MGGKKGPKQSAGSKTSSKADKRGGKAAGSSRKGCKASSHAAADRLHDPLDRELALVGLRVKIITADGNCFFRALSDQLQGDEAAHGDLRARACELMQTHPDDFAPFVEDDGTLEQHLTRMQKPGCWAGHMELQAASLLLGANLAIYQAGQPRWCITNHPAGSRMLHLAYEESHYNSLRRGDDFSRGQPADIPEAPLAPLSVDAVAQAQAAWSAADESLVAAGTGCDNDLLIRQQLAKAGGDVAAAIEAVIDILAAEEEEGEQAVGGEQAEAEQGPAAEEEEQQQQQQDDDGGGAVDAAGGQQASSCSGDAAAVQAGGRGEAPASDGGDAASPDTGAESTGQRSSSGSKRKGVKLQGRPAVTSSSSKGRDKAPGRNKPCPCGSGRRFKLCCGAASKWAKPEKAPAGGGSGDGLPVQLATLHI